ncbi:coproporphyrinogen dehydrogenase HemZ [Pseudoflavonifractor sp.]|jgi:oxygen-independent coproporphyrinogen-3 oxidase|uniref:coproporphyrinogen dehydrogenase HemZ n=1 Tax=Pseudoflavonifractor sp. TaxID=1980281 RepID=UPI003D90D7C6
MKLYLTGHDYKYACEQIMLTLFPGQRPLYPEEPAEEREDQAHITLFRGEQWATGRTALTWAGKSAVGSCRVKTVGITGQVELDRALQKALKLSFYRAAVAVLGKEPPWGALTGVRPVKIPTKALLRGETPAQAEALLRDTYHVTAVRRKLAMDCARASLAALDSLKEDEISLYVGIPFCPTRCAYCSFVSADVGKALKLLPPYLEALFREVEAAGDLLKRQRLYVRTVYIGGGTPTTLSAEQLSALMGHIRAHIDLSRCTEYTVEAGRPDTITAEKLAALKENGADRVSVNPQSMSDQVLRAMGRSHTAADILRAYELVQNSGIPCVNMDLIAGLPEDSPAGFRATLDQVLSMDPANITVHTLALKKGSRLMTEGGHLPTAEDVADMLDYAWTTLRGAGYVPYYLYRQKYMSGSFENVGWTRPGFENLYNICMMEELHSVLALGGGGVTKLVDRTAGRIERISDPKYPYEYINTIDRIIADKEKLADFYAARR